MASSFSEFFNTATNHKPFDYQQRLAGDPTVSGAILDGPKSLAINVPTGAGKTAAVFGSGTSPGNGSQSIRGAGGGS